MKILHAFELLADLVELGQLVVVQHADLKTGQVTDGAGYLDQLVVVQVQLTYPEVGSQARDLSQLLTHS